MPDNVDHICHFINSAWGICSHLGGWVFTLISKPFRGLVGLAFDDSISWLADKRISYSDFMECIDISSSDDDLEEIDGSNYRSHPEWAGTGSNAGYDGWSKRGSSSRRANTSNVTSSSVNSLSQAKPHTQPGSSNYMLNHRIARVDESLYFRENGNGNRSVNSRIANTPRPHSSPVQLFAPDTRFSNLKSNPSSSWIKDTYRNPYHVGESSMISDKGYMREHYSRVRNEEHSMLQNGGSRIFHLSLMHGKAISTTLLASSSESTFRAGAGEERASVNDERLIYQAALEDLNQPKVEATLPDGLLSVSLLRHQKIALAWMLQRETRSLHCLGGILADDQGLGKTVSMIALIQMQMSLQSKSKTDDSCIQKAEALNLDDDDDNGSVDVEKLKKDEESDIKKPIPEPSSSPRVLNRKRPAGGTLVVCPASVLRQWARELEDKVDDGAKLSVLIYHGGSRTKNPVELAEHDVVLTTYSIVTIEVPKQPLVEEDEIDERDGEKRKKTYNANKKSKKGKRELDNSSIDCASGSLAKVGWFRVILDEAQTIKNHRTQVARACCSLRAKRRWCLSGTPIQNAIDDLYSYFRFLKYDPYAVYKSFYDTIKVPISKNSIQGYKKLQAVLRAIMLRRTKGTFINGEPIIQLPTKTIRLNKVYFSFEERAFYKKLESDSRSQFKAYAAAGTVNQNYANILLMLLRLRQACDHPRLVKDYDSDPVGKNSVEMAHRLPRDMLINLFNCLETTFAICQVCNDPPEDAVITMCGHVFCYQCISEYLTGDDNTCPAINCKEQIGDDVVFSKATLRSCISDDHGGSTANSDLVDYSVVQQSEYSSSKIKAVLEILQSNCKMKSPVSGLPSSSGCRNSLSPDDSCIEDCNSDVTVLKHARKYSESTTEGPMKYIIFSQWTSMLDLVEISLNQSCIRYRRLDGTMTLSSRDKAVKDFNTDPEVTVMLMSLKAGNLGLNLVAACHVILLDLWWNPTTEDQAVDRAHRIGQTRPVTVTRITIKDTVEDRILALQEEKRKMVASAFGEDQAGGTATRLTVDDLKYLFMV